MKSNKDPKKRKEHGGSVYLDKRKDIRSEERVGVIGSMGRGSGNSLAAFRRVRKDSDFLLYILAYHTHPSGGKNPSGKPNKSAKGDYGTINKFDYNLGIRPAPSIGIIKYGPKDSDVTFYRVSGVISDLDLIAICIGE